MSIKTLCAMAGVSRSGYYALNFMPEGLVEKTLSLVVDDMVQYRQQKVPSQRFTLCSSV